MMLSKKQCEKKLSDMGVKTRFRTYQDESQAETEKGFISIKATHKLYDDGRFTGNCINQISPTLWGIWTSKTKTAWALHLKHGWLVQRMNKEAIINVPISFSDEILPMFGARTRPAKRVLSAEQYKASIERLEKARNARFSAPKSIPTPTLGGLNVKEG